MSGNASMLSVGSTLTLCAVVDVLHADTIVDSYITGTLDDVASFQRDVTEIDSSELRDMWKGAHPLSADQI